MSKAVQMLGDELSDLAERINGIERRLEAVQRSMEQGLRHEAQVETTFDVAMKWMEEAMDRAFKGNGR